MTGKDNIKHENKMIKHIGSVISHPRTPFILLILRQLQYFYLWYRLFNVYIKCIDTKKKVKKLWQDLTENKQEGFK